MRILRGAPAEAYVADLERRGSRLNEVEPMVKRIVQDVCRNGDRALRKYSLRFEGLARNCDLQVSESELSDAWKNCSGDLKAALRAAEKNIRQFCQWQKPKSWMRSRGHASYGQVVRPLKSVGCYVPGGRFPLVSTLLMTVIPAQVAGVENIALTSPRPSPELLAAAAMLGVRAFFRVGGAQAIAALAYGTETIPRVDKIVGPGNLYVTTAKKFVAFDCAIDMLAGPTEALILRDDGNPKFIAADLLAQAEHDPETLAIFITSSHSLASRVQRELELKRRECPPLDNQAIANASLALRGAILVARSRPQGLEWANRIAAEHITIEKRDLPFIQNAGSIFVGDYSAQAAGDYGSGPNHVLPTGGAARSRAGLSVLDFVKLITVQELSSKGLQRIAPTVVQLAETEKLLAHAESIRVRCASA